MLLHPHWTDKDLLLLAEAVSYEEMLAVALRLLGRMPRPVLQVCGPISTGGKGSIKENLEVVRRAIRKLTDEGVSVFDQTPFEEPIQRIHYEKSPHLYPEELLSDFYLPIFESGHIAEMRFLQGWEDSRGSTWEHAQAKRLGIAVAYFEEDWDL